ncbi:hypothetical protein HSB1_43900 [Halogranum salarium B-1]|uniref:Uncharacterized protein n=1 Tax=Halogranum salarium B-1 TaxID=1210908 RepID=J3JD84_9EURY|nr:hypothetical protein HSB1_43900 [Halogranum salarium B-1]
MQAKAVADRRLLFSHTTQENPQDTSGQHLLHMFYQQETEFVVTAVHTCYVP